MHVLSPIGDVSMAGTNTGRYLAVELTLAALRELGREGTYPRMTSLNDYAVGRLTEAVHEAGLECCVQGYGGRIGVHIGASTPPQNYGDVVTAFDHDRSVRLFRHLTENYPLFGFMLPLEMTPEPVTLSLAHSEEHIDSAAVALNESLKASWRR
jgi:glutamate-1-semialdehyde 2,1-aminomutase